MSGAVFFEGLCFAPEPSWAKKVITPRQTSVFLKMPQSFIMKPNSSVPSPTVRRQAV